MTAYPWNEGESTTAPRDDLARLFARVFAGPEGQAVLDWLRRKTLERILPPDAPDALLRHLEGQRQLVKLMETLTERGRQ